MNLLESILDYTILVDENDEPWYGSEQMGITTPFRFATVSIQLKDTWGLIHTADIIRMEAGYAPTTPIRGYSYEEYDENAWYDFFISINDINGGTTDNCITFVVGNSDQADNEHEYYIYLTDEEQKIIFSCIDKECKKKFGMDCNELLADARAVMLNE